MKRILAMLAVVFTLVATIPAEARTEADRYDLALVGFSVDPVATCDTRLITTEPITLTPNLGPLYVVTFATSAPATRLTNDNSKLVTVDVYTPDFGMLALPQTATIDRDGLARACAWSTHIIRAHVATVYAKYRVMSNTVLATAP